MCMRVDLAVTIIRKRNGTSRLDRTPLVVGLNGREETTTTQDHCPVLLVLLPNPAHGEHEHGIRQALMPYVNLHTGL